MHYTPQRLPTRRTRSYLRSLILLLISALATRSAAAAPITARVPPKLTAPATFLPITSATSLLVVSPHPDDESLRCSGVSHDVGKPDGHVINVWSPSGDAPERDLRVLEKSLFSRPGKV